MSKNCHVFLYLVWLWLWSNEHVLFTSNKTKNPSTMPVFYQTWHALVNILQTRPKRKQNAEVVNDGVYSVLCLSGLAVCLPAIVFAGCDWCVEMKHHTSSAPTQRNLPGFGCGIYSFTLVWASAISWQTFPARLWVFSTRRVLKSPVWLRATSAEHCSLRTTASF